MKIRKTHIILALVLLTVLLNCACTATWITALGAAIPAIQALVTAILAFVAALNGKTISANVAASVQKVANDTLTSLSNLGSLVASVTGAASAGVVAQIQAGLSDILTNLQSILSGFSVTDSATVAKFTELAGLGIAAVQAALALIPLVKAEDNTPLTAAETTVLEHHMKAFKNEYHVIRTTASGSVDVDAAVKAMPQSL